MVSLFNLYALRSLCKSMMNLSVAKSENVLRTLVRTCTVRMYVSFLNLNLLFFGSVVRSLKQKQKQKQW
jgi:hypothetical protein